MILEHQRPPKTSGIIFILKILCVCTILFWGLVDTAVNKTKLPSRADVLAGEAVPTCTHDSREGGSASENAEKG